MRAGATNSSDAAAAAEAARRAAEEAAREAAEQAQRQAAEQAQREAQQAEQAKQQAEAAQKSANQTEPKPETKVETDKNKVTEKPRSELEPYSERKNIDAKHAQNHFESKPKEDAKSKPKQLFSDFDFDQEIEKPNLGKQTSPASQSAQDEPGFLQQTFDKARSLAQKVSENPVVKDFIGKVGETANAALNQLKSSVNNSSENQKYAAQVVRPNSVNTAQKNDATLANHEAIKQNRQDEVAAEKEINSSPAAANQAAASSKTDSVTEAPPAVQDRILKAAQAGNSAESTEMIHDELKGMQGADAVANRARFIEDQKVQEAIGQVGKNVTDQSQASAYGKNYGGEVMRRQEEATNSYANLSRSAELVGSDGAATVARAFGKGMNTIPTVGSDLSTLSNNQTAVSQAITNGNGASFSANLATELHKVGKPEGEIIAKSVEQALTSVRENFEAKSQQVAELNTRLAQAKELSGLNPTDRKLQDAAANFMKKHETEFEEFEAAGKTLASTLQGAHDIVKNEDDLPTDNSYYDSTSKLMLDEAKNITAPETIAQLSQTKAGVDAIGQGIEQQAAGEKSFMDLIPDRLENGNDAAGHVSMLQNGMTKAYGARISEHVKNGDLEGAKQVLDTLDNNRRLFGINQAHLQQTADSMKAVLDGRGSLNQNSEEIKKLNSDLENSVRNLEGGNQEANFGKTGAKALAGIGFVVSVAGQADSFKGLQNANAKEAVGTISSAVGLSADIAAPMAQVFSKGSAAADLLPKLSGGASAVDAVIGGLSALESASKGEYANAAIEGSSAIGGGIMAANALRVAAGAQALPAAGQAIGIGLTAVGVAGPKIKQETVDEWSHEGELKQILTDSGMREGAAEILSDTEEGKTIGPFVDQLATHLGVERNELINRLGALDDEKLREFVTMAQGIAPNQDFKYPVTGSHDKDAGKVMHPGSPSAVLTGREYEPQSLEGAKYWMIENGIWR